MPLFRYAIVANLATRGSWLATAGHPEPSIDDTLEALIALWFFSVISLRVLLLHKVIEKNVLHFFLILYLFRSSALQ